MKNSKKKILKIAIIAGIAATACAVAWEIHHIKKIKAAKAEADEAAADEAVAETEAEETAPAEEAAPAEEVAEEPAETTDAE